jgi:hypothetical protein
MLKDEDLRLEVKKEESGVYKYFIESLLPKKIEHTTTEEEIREWLEANVDFSKLKNNMQAVGMAKKHFGDKADGSLVKEVVQSF